MPFIKINDGGSWTTYTKAFIRDTVWTTVKRIWMQIDSVWRVIWPFAGPTPITYPYIADTSASTTPLDNVNRRIGNMVSGTYNPQDLFAKNGTWDENGYTITSYSYRVRTSDNAAGTSGVTTKLSGTYSAPVQITLDETYDKKYLWVEITANTSTTGVTGVAESLGDYEPVYVLKRPPENISATFNSITLIAGNTLTPTFTWNTNDAYKDEPGRREIKWYKNTANNALPGGGRVEITSASGSSSYVIQSSDVGNYIIAEETRYNSGSDFDLGVTTGVSARVITLGQVQADISASDFALSNQTPLPTPSGVSVGMSGTTNVGLITWTNAATANSATVAWSGVASGGPISVSTSTTSRTFSVSSSGSVTATITNTRNQKVGRFSWSQAGARSWRINFSSSVYGGDSRQGNSTASSVSTDVDLGSNAGTITWNSLELFTQDNQQGSSTTFTVTVPTITPVDRTGTATGTGNVTYTPPPTLATPTFGTVTRNVGGFSVSISNYDSLNSYSVSTSSGSVSRSGATITVTGLSAGGSATVSVVASRTGYTNSNTGQVTGTAIATPSAPQSLSRSGTGLSKSFTWSAPSSDGGSTITQYQYSVDGGSSWLQTSSNTSQSYTYSFGGSVSFRVRAVNAAGSGTAAVLTFTIPTINSGPTAGSIGNTSASISWTSSSQSSYSISLSPSVSGSPFTGTTATSRSVTGLTAGTSYTATLTVSSSTGDTSSGSVSFSTTGGNVAPSGGTYTFSPTAPLPGNAITLTITNVSGTPASFTYAFTWARSSTSSQTSSYSTVKTTTAQASNSDSLSTTSTYNNRWVRVQTTVSNGVTPNLTSTQYIFVTDAV